MNDSLPKDFEASMQQMLGATDWQAFTDALKETPPTSIRLNPFKWKGVQPNYEQVAWEPAAYYLNERPVFTLDPIFHAGAYYVQEASSMFVGEAVRQLTTSDQPLLALDLCAAPGGKSTHLLSSLPKESLLVANEVIRSRFQILNENIIKWGQNGVLTTNHDSRDFKMLKGLFDLILVDAPCSGEGLFRKDKKAASEWSANNVQLCCGRQKRILADAVELLKPGGILLYSTCTYNQQENDLNVEWMANEWGLVPETIKIEKNWNIEKRPIGYQFYPHKVKGEGFFLACFRKNDGAVFQFSKKIKKLTTPAKEHRQILAKYLSSIDDLQFYHAEERAPIFAYPKQWEQEISSIAHYLKRINIGTELGFSKRKDFVPAHSLALSSRIHKDIPRLEISKKEALHYLKKDIFNVASPPQGWFIPTYKNYTLGWAKGLKNRINNYYPKNWRIKMSIDE
ncbi:MAG: RNA methyltransferase [Chitinophagales bacterium]|nr:RNA methyltransferase [Chitinophagales bacterium]